MSLATRSSRKGSKSGAHPEPTLPMPLVLEPTSKDPEGADLSVKALAEMARLSPVDIASVEAGADPKLETLWAVALALDVPFLELVKEARPNG